MKKESDELLAVAYPTANRCQPHPDLRRLSLFKTPNGRSANWYAGCHLKGRRHRKSLGTESWTEALKLSARWYEDIKYESRNGLTTPPSTPRFGKLVEATLAGMRVGEKRPRYIKGVQECLSETSYVMRFFGDKPISKVDSRSWDDFRKWLLGTREEEKKTRLSEKTVHQFKNAVRVVLRQAYVDRAIQTVPRFEDPLRPQKREGRPRTYFDAAEYKRLWMATLANVRNHKRNRTRWIGDAEELHDYVIFMVNTGLRVGESLSLRVRDVSIVNAEVVIGGERKPAEVCRIVVREGKRGAGAPCVSYLRAPTVFRRILKRRGITDPSTCEEPLFLKNHREAFKRILREIKLYTDDYGRKRDFVSLRHSYICFRLFDGAPVWQVAQNARTSAEMIDRHYAKSLQSQSLQVNVTG
jgi:integrase